MKDSEASAPTLPEDAVWKENLLAGKVEPLAFAEFALSRVSRTFALNIRVLPAPLRHQVLYAYLYCRMADTLEDDPHLPAAEKISLLKIFASLFTSAENGDAEALVKAIAEFTEKLPTDWARSSQWETLLLMHASIVLNPMLDFPKPVRQVIARCVGEMCNGMADFTGKHAQTADGHNLIETLEDLDSYCYYVAGTVGVLLCELFIRHSGKIGGEREKNLRALCVSFGLGLQLTNILKDLHDDKDRDVSWLPGELLAAEHMTFADFLKPEKRAATKRIYGILFSKAKKHLEDALEYSCLIPRWDRRLRLFCLWPLFMAAETLALLAESIEALTQGVRLKISRRKVENIVWRTQLFSWSNRWIHSEFRKPMKRLEHALQTFS